MQNVLSTRQFQIAQDMQLSIAEKLQYIFLLIATATIPIKGIAASGGITITRVLVVATLLLYLLSTLYTGRMTLPPKLLLYTLPFSVWAFVTCLWTVSLTSSFFYLSIYYYNLIYLYLISVSAIKNKLNGFLIAYVVGCMLMAFLSLSGTGEAVGSDTAYRSKASGGINSVGVTMGLGLIYLRYLLSEHRLTAIKENIIIVISILLGAAAVIATASRGGFLCLLLAVILIILCPAISRKKRWVFLITLIILTAGAFALLNFSNALPKGNISRIFNMAQSVVEDKGSGRTDIWQIAWTVFEENMVQGCGFCAFGSHPYVVNSLAAGISSQSGWVTVAASTGIIGFILYLAGFFWIPIKLAFIALRKIDRWFVIVLLIFIAVFFIPGDDFLEQRTWFAYAVIFYVVNNVVSSSHRLGKIA